MSTLFVRIIAVIMSAFVVYSFLAGVVAYFLLRRLVEKSRRLPPGPNPWPVVGNLPHLGAVPHHAMAALASKHGPLMYLRLGQVDVIVVASASVAAQFLKTHDANFSSRPPNIGAENFTYKYQDLVFAPYGPRWRLLRKLSHAHLFSAKALDDFKHIREAEVEVLTKELDKAGKMAAPVKLGQLLSVCTANALSRVMVGRRLFGSGDPMAVEFQKMVIEMMVLAGVFNIGDFIPVLAKFDLQGVAKKTMKLHKRFDDFLNKIVEDHVKAGKEEHKDLLSTLISLRDNPSNEESLTTNEIKALLLNMFSAGTDTSSSTAEWAVAEMIKNPTVRVRLQEELDAVVGRDRLVKDSDLGNLPYFQAVMKEVFRLHPSTPLSLPRVAAESCEINGYNIPQGATVLFNVWAIARDKGSWADPLEFRPERFLPGGEKPNVDMKGNDFELIPFGAGRRICAGMSLGIRMVQLLFATLVHAYDWEMADGQSPLDLNMEEAYGLTLQRAVPLLVNPKPRLAQQAYI